MSEFFYFVEEADPENRYDNTCNGIVSEGQPRHANCACDKKYYDRADTYCTKCVHVWIAPRDLLSFRNGKRSFRCTGSTSLRGLGESVAYVSLGAGSVRIRTLRAYFYRRVELATRRLAHVCNVSLVRANEGIWRHSEVEVNAAFQKLSLEHVNGVMQEPLLRLPLKRSRTASRVQYREFACETLFFVQL
jgi:hypothetical protein